MSVPLEILKFNLQEKEYPKFSDEELQMLLETNDMDLNKASYRGCIMKATSDDKIEVAGIKTESNRIYWLTLAEQFKPIVVEKKGCFASTTKRSDRK